MRKTELIKLVGTVITKNLKSLELKQKRPAGRGGRGVIFYYFKTRQTMDWELQ
jgi:hypothetical protein